MSEINQQKSSTLLNSIKTPSVDALKRLAISETGFVFDPESGHSFSVNETGMIILQQLQQQKSLAEILGHMTEHYQAEQIQIERDLIEFTELLRKHVLESTA